IATDPGYESQPRCGISWGCCIKATHHPMVDGSERQNRELAPHRSTFSFASFALPQSVGRRLGRPQTNELAKTLGISAQLAQPDTRPPSRMRASVSMQRRFVSAQRRSMVDGQAHRQFCNIALKWRDLVERRRAYFAELYHSGRWKIYYTEQEFV